MKDIRFWRAEYPEDIIGCDRSNRGSKMNALVVVEDEALLSKLDFFFPKVIFVLRNLFWEQMK